MNFWLELILTTPATINDPLNSSYLNTTMSLSQNRKIHEDKSDDDNVIRRHYDFLVDRMSSEFGLITNLFANRTLNSLQKSEIEGKSLIHERNEILLKHIVKKNACEKLFEALKMCGQSHLVNYMEADGVYKPEFGGIWPLSEKERTVLLDNYAILVDLLDSKEVVGMLFSAGVLNKRQRNLVYFKEIPEEQNEVLLEILLKGSLDNYWQMIRCLHLSNQSHIAKIFETGGVVVRIDANLQPVLPNQREVENSLVAKITNLLYHEAIPETLLEETYQILVAVAAKHSISFYFLCPTQGDIDCLEQMASNGQLKKFIEDLFNRLMDFPKRIRVTLKWSRHLLSKSRKHMKAIKAKNSACVPMNTTIQCIPLKLLDTILQNVYLLFILQSGAWSGATDSDIIALLASVDSCWSKRILRKRLKQRILLMLKKIYRRDFEMYFSYTGWQCYLEEGIQVEAVRLRRNKLLAADCLTDLRIERILRKKLSEDKKDSRRRGLDMITILAEEIFPVRREFERENLNKDFSCRLRQANQILAARVLEQEGIAAKVVIRRPSNSKTETWSREFSKGLNNSSDRNQFKSRDIEEIIENLEDSDLDILNSFVDRGVTVWIWCKSQSDLENLKTLYKSETLIDRLYRLGNEKGRSRNTKDIHLEEISQLKIAYIRNQDINIKEKLQTDEDFHWVTGVTKLRNKIFVLGHSRSSDRNVVYVFDDQYPFRRQLEMTFEDIDDARAILSFEKDICLYITDFGANNNCVWKIHFPDEDKIDDGEFTCTVLKCIEFPNRGDYRMTITDEGHFVIIDREVPVLLFYESESALNRPIHIDLPDAIYYPFRVAVNSAGNVIILHRKLNDDDHGVVSEVDRNGKTIIRQHLGTRDRWIGADEFVYFQVDSKDRIILSDYNRNRLVFLDSHLRHLRSFTLYIEGEDGEKRLFRPRKLFYDGGKNQLIVAERDKVFVHSFSGI